MHVVINIPPYSSQTLEMHIDVKSLPNQLTRRQIL